MSEGKSQGTKEQIRRFLERAVAESNLKFDANGKIVVKSMGGDGRQKIENDIKKRANHARKRFGI